MLVLRMYLKAIFSAETDWNTSGLWKTAYFIPIYLSPEEKIGYGYCPANGKGKYASPLFKNDVDEYCPSLNFRFIMQNCSMVYKNGYIYSPVNAFKFFEEGAKPPFPDLTEDSNPVIVKLKLKKKETQ